MHFCLTGQYTPRALNAILENPTTNRQEAARKLIEAAGGKLVSMYSVAADGPGVLVIFDVPDPSAAPAISGLTVTTGALQNVKLTRLFTQDEIKQVRQKRGEAALFVYSARRLTSGSHAMPPQSYQAAATLTSQQRAGLHAEARRRPSGVYRQTMREGACCVRRHRSD
ncbi:uncharacterized protein with GYD domain [Bradyrhizobium japonicum]